jgi:hypothetical protein
MQNEVIGRVGERETDAVTATDTGLDQALGVASGELCDLRALECFRVADDCDLAGPRHRMTEDDRREVHVPRTTTSLSGRR